MEAQLKVELGGRQVEARYRQPKAAEIGPPRRCACCRSACAYAAATASGSFSIVDLGVALALVCVPAALLPAVRSLGS
jgi:hypothetical protein